MNQLSEKELSALNDSLSEEELLVKKFQALGQQATDPEIKEEFTRFQRSISNISTCYISN